VLLFIVQGSIELPKSRDPIEALSMMIRFSLGLTQAIQHVESNDGIPSTGIGLVARCFKISCAQGVLCRPRDYGFYETITCLASPRS